MRGGSRRSDAVEVSLGRFAWPHATIATLRHSTLAWPEAVVATPLAGLTNCGARDRLSLAGQFAAHIALLQFAGIGDSEFSPDGWMVVRKRGADCRLVRVAATRGDVEALHNLHAFAEFVGVAIDALEQSWTRAESVYAEVFRRIADDAAADVRWLRRSAVGEIAPPGPDALAAIWRSGGPHWATSACEVAVFRAYAALDRSAELVIAGTEFPIQPFSALAPIDPALPGSKRSPAEVADMLVERLASKRHVLVVAGNVDEHSRRVIEILSADREQAHVAPRWLVISTRLGAQHSVEERLNRASDPRRYAEDFAASAAYDVFLADGTLPVDDNAFAQTPEPRRSYIAALALIGTRIPRALASDFLRQFLFEQPLEELLVDGVTSVDGGFFLFASDAVREYCSRHIPEASRPALCRSAAAVADPLRSALLLIETGDIEAGVARLESVAWTNAEETIAALAPLPRSVLTPKLASVFAHALVDAGRYADARALSPLAADAEFLLARCERRTGDYETALARTSAPSLLRAELLRITGRLDEAIAVLDQLDDCVAVQYERALVALDRDEQPAAIEGDHYFALRLATYRALLENDFETAAESAARSFEAARCAAERIDAALDRVFASFSTGRWSETRALALEALALVDEAQGDRAAAGIMFTLAFVEADDGRWTAATEHIERLRAYYTGDPQRLTELDLLSSYVEFTRGRLADAHRLAIALLSGTNLMPQIREAAALVADEVDWIEKRDVPLRSTGSHNRELDERHRLMRLRRGRPVDAPLTGFAAELAHWEGSPHRTAAPRASSRGEKLKLFRSALGSGRDAVALSIGDELSISVPAAASARTTPDVDILRVAAVAEYPFRADTFSGSWCYATRNRLGQWSQDGPRSFDAGELDRRLAAAEGDWLRSSDRELLFIEGCGNWPDASRDAVAALFRTRAENHRLHRVLEQDDPAPPTARQPADGFIGESAAMRAVFSLIDRIASRDVPVCILGESGTGKELAGRAIHRVSPRKHKPFTAINCAALPENLIESELFGHVRGAFTGADRDRAGLIETTDCGTLFLDEIGEMPLAAQAKLLRFLQEGEFRRVGDVTNRSADVRVVSATNRKLESAVEEGRFREDLYYRVRGVEIVMPPLRDRSEDVVLLARHFLALERGRHKSGPQMFAPDVEALFRSYEWPGNVRELQNTVRAAHAIAGDARAIDIDHLPERLRKVVPAKVPAGSYQDAVVRFRRDLIEKSLVAASGNQNQAAALLKISRQALAYQIRELGIMVTKTAPRPRV
ncbi:MAG TPA: sigma 54-interacting transcriptional regulator [Thermoanaerobaculia bacterium]|nr:sigma 54-interacting transcriptional regulator [Thermoanaerobaculia bacterium]